MFKLFGGLGGLGGGLGGLGGFFPLFGLFFIINLGIQFFTGGLDDIFGTPTEE